LHEATFGHTLKVFRRERESGDGYFFRLPDGDGTVCLEAQILTENI